MSEAAAAAAGEGLMSRRAVEHHRRGGRPSQAAALSSCWEQGRGAAGAPPLEARPADPLLGWEGSSGACQAQGWLKRARGGWFSGQAGARLGRS